MKNLCNRKIRACMKVKRSFANQNALLLGQNYVTAISVSATHWMAYFHLSKPIFSSEQWSSKWSISTPRGQLDHPKGWWIVTGLNKDHWMARGSMNNCWGLLDQWRLQFKIIAKSGKECKRRFSTNQTKLKGLMKS